MGDVRVQTGCNSKGVVPGVFWFLCAFLLCPVVLGLFPALFSPLGLFPARSFPRRSFPRAFFSARSFPRCLLPARSFPR